MADRHWGGAVKGGTTENEKTVLSVSCSLCPCPMLVLPAPRTRVFLEILG